MSTSKSAIVGIGNTLLQDEGVGMYMTQLLEDKYQFSPSVDFHYIGTGGLVLADIIEPYDFVIFLDTIIRNESPGTIITLDQDQLRPHLTEVSNAGHAIGLQAALALANFSGGLPHHFSLVAMVPAIINFGQSLSINVQRAIPNYEKEIVRVLNSRQLNAIKKAPHNRTISSLQGLPPEHLKWANA